MRSRRMLWLILFLGSIILISFRGGNISYCLFFFLLLFPIFSYLYLFLALVQFRIYQSLDSRVITAGIPMKYCFTLNNEGWLPISCLKVELFPDFSYVEDIPQQKEFELLPGESYTFETTMVCKYRGVYRVGVKTIILSDFLRVFTLRYPIQGALEAIVNPRIPEEDEYESAEEVLKVLQRENTWKKENLDSVVREYVPGDTIRGIHWQATAKTGRLQSRREIGEERNNIYIYLDTTRVGKELKEYLPIENKKLELVLYLAKECLLKGQPVTVLYPQKDVTQGRIFLQRVSAEQYRNFDQIYDVVKEMEFFENPAKDGATKWWDEEAGNFTADACWIFVLQKPDEDMKDRLQEWKNRGMDLAVYLVGEHEENKMAGIELPLSLVSVEDSV